LTQKFSSPIIKTRDLALKPFNNFFSYFDSKKELENTNDDLRKEISNLKIEVLSSIILKTEYQSLLKQSNKDENEIIAKVVFKPPFSSFNNLIISNDSGTITEGQKIYYQNVILGEVVDVSDEFATVKLFSASGNSSIAKLTNGNEVEVVGRGTGQYEIILPKEVDVSENDPIIYPENEIVLFGLVNKVFATEDDLFNKVLFNIPIDFARVNYVRVGAPLDILE